MAVKLFNAANATLDPLAIAPVLQTLNVAAPPTVVTDQIGEKWDISAPSDVAVSVTNDATGMPHITFQFNYSPSSLFNSAAHGIESIKITPEANGVGNATGFKAIVDLDVTNGLPVTMGGFLAYLVDNQPATGPLDKGDVHPNNYSHFHNVPANAFAPETVTLATPDFLPAGPGVAPSNISATGVLTPGQTVTATGMTMHQEELVGHDNGFTLNFFPFGDPNPKPPTITGLPASEVAPPIGDPFAAVSVNDTSILPIESATITIDDAAGNPTDADGTLSNGVIKTGVGTYTVAPAFPADMTQTLDSVVFTPTPNATGAFKLAVTNGTQTISATEGFTAPLSAVITTEGPSLTANGHSWSLLNGQVAVDGGGDPTTSRVVAIESDRGRIYQENADKNWWSKAQPGDNWTFGPPPDGSVDPPLHVSANNSVLTDGRHTIVDAANNTWSIVNGQVSVDGTVDQTTANVVELAYENGKIWQENAGALWWSKTTPSELVVAP